MLSYPAKAPRATSLIIYVPMAWLTWSQSIERLRKNGCIGLSAFTGDDTLKCNSSKCVKISLDPESFGRIANRSIASGSRRPRAVSLKSPPSKCSEKESLASFSCFISPECLLKYILSQSKRHPGEHPWIALTFTTMSQFLTSNSLTQFASQIIACKCLAVKFP